MFDNSYNYSINFINMTKYISTKQLYTTLKEVSEEVMAGDEYVVLKHSKPAYKIVPFTQAVGKKAKYSLNDLNKFIFKGDPKNGNNLAENYKEFIY